MSKTFLQTIPKDSGLVDAAEPGRVGFDIDEATGLPFVIDDAGLVTFTILSAEVVRDIIAAAFIAGAVGSDISVVQDDPTDKFTVTIKTGVVTEAMLAFAVATQTELDAEAAARVAADALKENTANKSTDTALGGGAPSNTLFPTQAAVKSYTDTAIAAAVVGLADYRGTYNASGNTFPSTGGSGVGGAVLKADFWICSVTGTLGGTVVSPGSLIIATVDAPGQTGGNWDLVEHEFTYAPEDSANKSNDTTMAADSATLYPTQHAAKIYADTVAATKQPLDATLTNLASQNWAANAIPIGTGADTVGQTAFGANTFPARGSTGGLVAKPITDAGLSWANLANSAAQTASLDVATQLLKGLLANLDKRKLDMMPNIVTDYGADPTNVADCTAAFTSAAASGNGIVVVPDGHYLLNLGSGLIPVTGNTVFVGSNRKKSIIHIAHATNTAFQFRNWGGGFVDIGFDGPFGNPTFRTGGTCIDMPSQAQQALGSGSRYCFLNHVDIYNQAVGVHSGDHVQWFDDVEIRFPQSQGIGGMLFDGAASANDKRVSNITIQGNPANKGAGQYGIRITQCASFTMMGRNDIVQAGNGLDLIPGSGEVIPSIKAHNTFFDQNVIGVNFAGHATLGTIQRCIFVNCWMSSNSTAGVLIAQINTQAVLFDACEFFGAPAGLAQAVGIDVTALQPTINTMDWAAVNCRFAGNSTAAIRTAAGAQAGHSFMVHACVIGACGGFAANAQAFSLGAGTYQQIIITDNRGLDQNTTPGLAGIPGTVLTTVATNFNVSNNMGTAPKGLIRNITAAVTANTTETVIIAVPIPANGVLTGASFDFEVGGIVGTVGNPTFRVKVGPNGTAADTLVLASGALTGTAAVAGGVRGKLTIRALGNPGTVTGDGLSWSNNNMGPMNTAQPVATVPNTTAQWFITITIQMSAGTFVAHTAMVTQL